jgi:hypothetical protein
MTDYKNTARLIVCILLLITFGIVFGLLYLISYIITTPGSVLLFFVIFHLGLKFIINLITFPGSFWVIKKSIEKNFSRLMTSQLSFRLGELVEFLNENSSTPQSRNYINISSIIQSISKIIENLQMLEAHSLIKPKQQELLKILLSLYSNLDQIKLKYSDATCSLLEWCKELPCSIDQVCVYPENLQSSIDVCRETNILIHGSNVFGYLDYMRSDLINKFKCEQTWIEMNDRTKLDW